MFQADHAIVHAREVGGAVVEGFFTDLARLLVDDPAVQQRWRAIAIGQAHREFFEATDVEHDLVSIFVRIDRVEDVAGIDLVPDHVGVAAVARHHAQTRTVVVAPGDRHAAARGQAQIEHHRQIHEDHVVSGHVPVVHHGRALDVDLFALHERSVLGHSVVDEVGRELAVAEEEQFAGFGADARMRSHCRRELASKIVGADGFEFVAQRKGKGTLFEGEDFAAVANHVGIRTGKFAVDRAVGCEPLCVGVAQQRSLNVAVAIPERLAVAQGHPVNHPIAEEPMGRGAGLGIRTVAKEAPVQFRRNRTRDLEVQIRVLLEDRSEVPAQVEGGLLSEVRGLAQRVFSWVIFCLFGVRRPYADSSGTPYRNNSKTLVPMISSCWL